MAESSEVQVPLVVNLTRGLDEPLGLAVDHGCGLVKDVIEGGALYKALDKESLERLKSKTMKLLSVNQEEIQMGCVASQAALVNACKGKTDLMLVFVVAESATQVAIEVHRDTPDVPLGITVDPATGKILDVERTGPIGLALTAAATAAPGDTVVDYVALSIQRYALVGFEGQRLVWGTEQSEAAVAEAVVGKTDFLMLMDAAPPSQQEEDPQAANAQEEDVPAIPQLPPFTVTVQRDAPDVPVGLDIDYGTGKVRDAVEGGALYRSIDSDTVAKIRSGQYKLRSVNGTEIPMGRTDTLATLRSAFGADAVLELVFDATSPTAIAVPVKRGDPDTPLGLSLNAATGKVQAIDADGPVGTALRAAAGNAEGVDNVAAAVERYAVVAVEGRRIVWGSDDNALVAAVEGLTEFVLGFDVAPPRQHIHPALRPLWERRPELYRPISVPRFQMVRSSAGTVRTLWDSDGNIVQQVREETPVRVQEIQRPDGSKSILRVFADGHEEFVELRWGTVSGNVRCPLSWEQLDQWEVDSCYGRFPLVQLEVYTKDMRETLVDPINNRRSSYQVFICKLCKLEKKFHGHDGSRPPRPEDDYVPRSHMSCAMPTGYFEKYTKFPPPAPIFCKKRHPETDALLCITCKYPIDAHPVGPDPVDAAFEDAGVADLMYVLSGGRDGRKAEPGKESPKLKAYLMSQKVANMFGGGAGGGCIPKPGPIGDWKPEDGPQGADIAALAGIRIEGYLQKYSIGKSGIIKNWKKRYFNLMGGVLQYREGPGGVPKGTIAFPNLTGTRVVTTCTPKTHPQAGQPDDIVVIYDERGTERRLLLRCGADHAKWADALSKAAVLVNDKNDM